MERKRQIDHALFVERWNEGRTVPEISKELGLSEAYVYKYANVHRDECVKRKSGRKTEFDHQTFVKKWNDGFSPGQIATDLGISVTSVYNYAALYRDECPVICRPRGCTESRINHEKFVKLWLEGATERQMGNVFGVCKQRISAYAKLHSDECPKRKLGGRRIEIDREEFESMYNSGASMKCIAEKLRVSVKRIIKYAKLNGYKRTRINTGKISSVPYEEFERMWNAGVSARKIAEHFGISVNYVYNYVVRHREMGLKNRH